MQEGRDQGRNRTEHDRSSASTCVRKERSTQKQTQHLASRELAVFSRRTARKTAIAMEPAVQTATAIAAFDRETFHRRVLRKTSRGASSHFVRSSIMILSSFALSTLAMNCGKKILESRNKPNEN